MKDKHSPAYKETVISNLSEANVHVKVLTKASLTLTSAACLQHCRGDQGVQEQRCCAMLCHATPCRAVPSDSACAQKQLPGPCLCGVPGPCCWGRAPSCIRELIELQTSRHNQTKQELSAGKKKKSLMRCPVRFMGWSRRQMLQHSWEHTSTAGYGHRQQKTGWIPEGSAAAAEHLVS